VLIGKINTLIWFRCMKKKKSLMEDRRNNKAQKPHTHQNPQKAHPTGEFIVVV